MSAAPKSATGRLIVLAVAILMLSLVLRRAFAAGFDPHLLRLWLSRADWMWLLGSWLLILITYFWRAVRWNVFLRPLNAEVGLLKLYSSTTIGFAAVLLLSRAGEIVRPWLIARHARVSLASQIAAWVLERIYDLLSVLAVFGFSLAVVQEMGMQTGPRMTAVLHAAGFAAGSLASVSLIALFAFQVWPEPFARLLKSSLRLLPESWRQHAKEFIDHGVDLVQGVRSPSAIAQLILFSFLHWFTVWLGLRALFNAFPETAAFGSAQILIFLGFVAFGSIVQLPGVGGGYQLIAILVLTDFLGVRLEGATGFALVSWITTFVVVVPVGLLFAVRQGLTFAQLKSLQYESPT